MLTVKQRGVAIGAISALLMSVLCIILAAHYASGFFDVDVSLEFRLRLFAVSLMGPTATLLICIARLANHRFFSEDDIDGSALTDGTPQAKLLQALLQNTLEQLAIAAPVYFLAALTLQSAMLGVIPAVGGLFFVGRMFFFKGYAKGASSRAFGFALTFYSTVSLALTAINFVYAIMYRQ